MLPQFNEINQAAAGRWGEILPALTGLLADVLTKGAKDHPCPLCGGASTIWPADDAQATGRIACRKCTANKPTGDGIATVATWGGMSMGDAARAVADHLGMSLLERVGAKPKPAADLIAAVCADKRMPLAAFMQFNPTIETRGRQKNGVVRVPVWNEKGEQHSYFDLAVGHKGWFARGVGMAGLFFPGRLPVAGETWHSVEGVKDSSALVGLGYLACGLPTSFMADKYARLFAGCHIVLVPDLDSAGQAGAQKSGGNLSGVAASVRVCRLPGEILDKSGDDVRDVLKRPDGERLVREAIDTAEPWTPREGEIDEKDGRPEVLLSLTEGHVADQVVTHIGRLGWDSGWIPEPLRESVKVYVRGGTLVDAIESEDERNRGQLVIRSIPNCIVRERITQSCQLVTEKAKGDETEVVPSRPPKWLIDSIHSRGWFNSKIRPLAGVVQSPTLRPDGSILQRPGYDTATGLIYRPNAQFPAVPDKPTRGDAERAIAELLETIVDFPLQDDADKSAWAAMTLTMIGRACVPSCCPMFVVTANRAGAGKGLFLQSAARIAYGLNIGTKSYSREDEEMRKLVTTVALEAWQAVLFDNLNVQLGGAALDSALTAETWNDRILGRTASTGVLPMRTVWTCTGNNLAFGTDISRRVLPIRLFTPLESPELRTDFTNAELLPWVTANRPRLAVAALTILRAYFVAGCPEQPGGAWGSYESWSAIIRGAIVWAGAADPLPTRATATANDDARALLAMLITGIEEADPCGTGLTTKEIERLTTHRPDDTPPCPTLVAAASEICGERFNAKRFGRRVRGFVGRTWEGRRIESDTSHGKVMRWVVRAVNEGFGGFGGCSNNHLTHGNVCVSPRDTHSDTQEPNRERGESEPPNPPNPPSEPDAVPAPAEQSRMRFTL